MKKKVRHMRGCRCDWCAENSKCISLLKKAYDAAPGWLEVPILLVIEALERDNAACGKGKKARK